MLHIAERRRIDPARPDAAVIDRAVRIIQAGGAVVFPTHSLYGLAVRADSVDAVARLFDIKQRPARKPVSILIGRTDDVDCFVRRVSETARRLMGCFWPGRLTLVFTAADPVCPALTAGTGTLGIRLPAYPSAAALVRAAGVPITATSANRSGYPGVARVDDLPRDFLSTVDLILDAGVLAGGVGSTVVDVTGDPIRMVREGRVTASQIAKCVAADPAME